MRYTYNRGLKKVEDENHLRFACFNIKKMVRYIVKVEEQLSSISIIVSSFSSFYLKFVKIFDFIYYNKKVTFLFVTLSTV